MGAFPEVFGQYGGAIQRRVAALAQAQARLGYDVSVYSPGSDRRETSVGGVRVHYVPCRLRGRWMHLEYQLRVASALRRTTAPRDVVHFHSEPEGAVLCHQLSCATVLSYDNYYFRGGRQSHLYGLYRRALLQYDMLLPCSDYCRVASQAYWDLPEHKIVTLPNGVDCSHFRRDPIAAERERRSVGTNGQVVLYLGRVCEQKGTDTLLDAYSLVQAHGSDVDLVIAGPVAQFGASRAVEDERDWTKRMAASGARYLGAIHESRLPGVLSLADVFVMPSRELEMFGMAAIEAQACGTPVVASDHGGLKETVPSTVGGRFPPGDATALADMLLRLLGDDEARRHASSAASQHAQRYSWDNIAARSDAIYSDLLASRKVKAR